MADKKRIEFSKIVLVIMMILDIAVIIFACVMMWRTDDLTPLAYLIPSIGAEISTGTAFYYWKARAENKIKLAKLYGIELTENTLNV